MIELTAADGHTFSAYRADPSDTPKGAVVVLQDIFGVNSHLRKIAEGFAAKGYVAIVPALFERATKGVELGYDESQIAEGEGLAKEVGTDGPLTDIQAAIDAVKNAGKVAIVGYSWGGYLAYLSANRVNGLACAIGYYGSKIVHEYQEKRKIPTLIHFGDNDPLLSAEDVVQFRAQRPDVSVYTYPAGHDFACDERDGYDEDAASRAFDRTLFWISQFVEGQPPVLLKNSGAYAQQKADKKKKKPSNDDQGPPMD
ncbi:MAG TPA: dienelactone hydrolase family protein [Methylocella sp.]|nr:dienelactone hydrolase family protein [Methylocella sp.]